MNKTSSDSIARNVKSSIVWFRHDLRLSDNPALDAAVKSGKPIYCIYVDETNKSLRPLGGAARWWLHHSLKALEASLSAIGGSLACFVGDSEKILAEMAQAIGADEVHWSRRYGGAEREVDAPLGPEGSQLEVERSELVLEPEPFPQVRLGGGVRPGVFELLEHPAGLFTHPREQPQPARFAPARSMDACCSGVIWARPLAASENPIRVARNIMRSERIGAGLDIPKPSVRSLGG